MVRLARVDRSRLHATFLEAFADYAVDVSGVTEEVKRIRAVKNAVDWDLSVGAFEGARMVGFTLLAVDDWHGTLAAYDGATGVVPDFRGRGLAAKMLEHAMPELRDRGVTRMLLEVLEPNTPAIRAYEKASFRAVRKLACFALDVERPTSGTAPSPTDEIRPVDRDIVTALADAMDWQPSWENSLAAIRRIPDELVVLGAFRDDACVGSIVYTPTLNWIMNLVVRPSRRRQGIGSALLQALIQRLPEEVTAVRLLNVDGGDRGMRAFLKRLGFSHTIDQLEMSRSV